MTEETPFRSVFTKKSNFLTQSFVTSPVNIVYGSSGKFLVPRHGDFITRMHLLIEYSSTKSTKVNQAHAMLDYAEIVIGGVTVQRETGETLNMRLNLDTVEQQRFGITQFYRMLGGGPSYPFTDVGQFPRPYTLAIPLNFWFHGKTELAFPLAALRWQEVEVNVGLRNSSRWGGTDFKVKGSNVRLQIEYGYVNEEVRKSLMKRTYLFPTEQFQFQRSAYYTGDTELNFPPSAVEENTGSNFVNPVKALFAFYQGKENETGNIFDYSRGYTYSELTNSDGNDYLRTMGVELDGETLLPDEVGTPEFLRGFQYYAHFPGSTQNIESPYERYYSYIYALALCKDPMSRTKINGGINFTVVKKPIITLDSKGNGGVLNNSQEITNGSSNTLVIPYLTSLSVNATSIIEEGQYVRGLNIVNDTRVSSLRPTDDIFYGNLGSSNVTISTNTVASNCIQGATVVYEDQTTTISSVYAGSGAKATINYSLLGSTDMSITPTDYSIPEVGDHITLSNQEFDKVVTAVYGSSVLKNNVLDKDGDGRVFLDGSDIPIVGMYTSENAIVQNYNTTIDIVFGQVSDILGSTPFPTSVNSFELPDLVTKTHLVNVLISGTRIISEHIVGPAIDRIEGTTVYIKGYFTSLDPAVNLTMSLSINWVTLNQSSSLSSGSELTFYPRVVFNSASTTEPTGDVVFGNKLTLANPLTVNGGQDLGETGTLQIKDIAIMDKSLVNPITAETTISFYDTSSIVAKLYALSINFIFIENGRLKLVYDNSEMTLPRFI